MSAVRQNRPGGKPDVRCSKEKKKNLKAVAIEIVISQEKKIQREKKMAIVSN